MSYNIQNQIAEAHAAYETALARLDKARDTYDQGPKSELVEILEQQKVLSSKIAACRSAAEVAEQEFKQAFERANYERTSAVSKALERKSDALAMAEEVEAALFKAQARATALLLDANPQAKSLLIAHEGAKRAYGMLKIYEAMGEPSQAIKNAIALAFQTIPATGDSLGRPAYSNELAMQERSKRIAFIWDGLVQMAANEDVPQLPFAEVSIAPLKRADLLSPGQERQQRQKLTAGADQ